MTRLIPTSAHAPLKILKADHAGDALYLCRCGLSANGPFCDGSHKATLDEQPGAVYSYERIDGKLTRIASVPSAHHPAPPAVTGTEVQA